jgi:hypothetical protein
MAPSSRHGGTCSGKLHRMPLRGSIVVVNEVIEMVGDTGLEPVTPAM